MKNPKRIYFDYAAATPIDKKVAARMSEIQKRGWANPSSLHKEGETAKEILERSRIEIAKILNCRTGEIYFTSGATEALNIAILGIVSRGLPLKSLKLKGRPQNIPHIITSPIEHPAILGPIKSLLKENKIKVSFVCSDRNGRISPELIKKEIKENTVLVCLAHANSEIGVIQPIREISNVIKSFRKEKKLEYPYFLVDVSQSALYENVSVERLGADLLVLDGIKIHGPRGGILLAKKEVPIAPITWGGGQESSLRPGTENVAAASGLALALQMANKTREKESSRLSKLRNYAVKKILGEIPGSSLNGSLENRLPNNLNICFVSPKHSQVNSEFLVIKLDTLGFAVSAASACQNISDGSSSHVLEALGKPECASSSLRITLGRETRKSDLDKLIESLKKIIK